MSLSVSRGTFVKGNTSADSVAPDFEQCRMSVSQTRAVLLADRAERIGSSVSREWIRMIVIASPSTLWYTSPVAAAIAAPHAGSAANWSRSNSASVGTYGFFASFTSTSHDFPWHRKTASRLRCPGEKVSGIEAATADPPAKRYT
jgi:hypothetical protein